ncbi:zinc ribbon domain-containing protein [Diplocloster hominis]|uniref:zinc ribbon domain-containing protein n=1 Tax=Diplocloster hominis TaxID=3079010 RepID=UPI0031BA9970
METRDAILELRKSLNLSQDEFAEKLLVTRQAVSRWENGETTPNIDTLKLLASIFDVSVDYLLGQPAGQCQSCGMIMEKDSDKGTQSDGSKSEEYCAFCYRRGEFAQDITMEEMIEHNLKDLDEWNKDTGLHLTEQEAREQLREFLPTLKRWKKDQ